jgi:hypothetical protein
LVTITANGRETIAKQNQSMRDTLSHLFVSLGEKDTNDLVRIFTRIREMQISCNPIFEVKK